MLRILGKNKDWYLIDYCDTIYKKGHVFESGEIIEDISDQFGNNMTQTEIGWKCLCKVKNIDDSKLKELSVFEYVKNPLELK